MRAKTILFFICAFLFSHSFAGDNKELYIFDMGSCLVALPDGYQKINRNKPDIKYNFIEFQSNDVHFKVTLPDLDQTVRNEEKLKFIESLDSVDLTLYEYDTTGFDFTIFVIEGASRVITLSHGTKEEALNIAHSCSR